MSNDDQVGNLRALGDLVRHDADGENRVFADIRRGCIFGELVEQRLSAFLQLFPSQRAYCTAVRA
jgi:hypothetical protein